ncbi:hypothetical protein H2200_001045 [Cladophialophora chaetospira]|uniref:Uncharacterized protein n=1 Tax=Cladophialophora chaetospira TaxID=386627 RepID=A0AA38XK94_9EURO|nr:hypothetical protein H2200_001045 [Cladophialophora chaetospira]
MATVSLSSRAAETASFRRLLPPKDWPKIKSLSTSTARQWYEDKKDVPALQQFLRKLEVPNIPRPFVGFTTDGKVIDKLFQYAPHEGAPTAAMIDNVAQLLRLLSPEQKACTMFESVEDDMIRIWSNPEFYVNPGGLRLDEYSESVYTAVHNVLRSSLSPVGYTKALGCCLVNGFLGKLVDGHKVMNEHSYNFRLFGHVSMTEPWGYTFFGHHLCLAVVVQGGRMVIGPTFMGAEPDVIDEGPHAGLRLFSTERQAALKLMQSLSPELKVKTTLWQSVLPKELPPGRWTAHDERHVGGAGHDNRVVPYEGCPVSLFDSRQQNEIVRLFRAFNEYYPDEVLDHRTKLFKDHLHQTYFAWIGGHDDDAVYYFRIHSPVAFMEFDFHSGVYLTNETPDKCHIHTINRIPNRGDYGRALIAQYWEEQRQAHSSGHKNAQTVTVRELD